MGHQQQHRHQENGHVDNKGLPAGNGRPGVQRHGRGAGRLIPALNLPAEAEIEIGHHHHHAQQGNEPCVPEKIPKGQPQGRANDDVGRVPAHGGRTAQVGGENLRDNQRNRIKLQQVGQADTGHRQKQNHCNAVNEHGQHRRQDHKADHQRHRLIVDQLGQAQAQPVKESRLAHSLHHNHHPADEENGAPVDAGVHLIDRHVASVPEGGLRHALQAQRLPHIGEALHGQQKDHHQGHQIPGEFLPDNLHKHDHKNYHGQDLTYHAPFLPWEKTGQNDPP